MNGPLPLCQECLQPQSRSGFSLVVDAEGRSGVWRTEGSAHISQGGESLDREEDSGGMSFRDQKSMSIPQLLLVRTRNLPSPNLHNLTLGGFVWCLRPRCARVFWAWGNGVFSTCVQNHAQVCKDGLLGHRYLQGQHHQSPHACPTQPSTKGFELCGSCLYFPSNHLSPYLPAPTPVVFPSV